MSSDIDVLIFGAHPDDAEFSMAGTMIRFADAGLKVMHVVLTRSEMSTHGDIQTRKLEFEKACEVIGCQGRMLELPDTDVQNTRENRLLLARIIRETKPKIVFGPYHTNPIGEMRGLAHVDHYTTGELVRDAVKMARLQRTIPDMPAHNINKLYFFMLPKSVRATIFMDVTNVIERVKGAIAAYNSQMAIGFKNNDIEYSLMTRRAAVGLEIGCKFAEQFTTELPLTFEPADFIKL